ncbi:MAG: transporter substrate-binding domain-containing protein [Cellvibrio sp.]|uniref:substrate-binding periplasmic protein n=1 Tax=Cellvibrio sp. TaxID=1965322 RepID=UPI0031A7074A
MRFGYLWVLILVAFSAANGVADPADTSSAPSPNAPINLATNISSAFSADLPAGSNQELLPHLQCIFKQMGREFNVQVIPWRRAYQDVKSNRIDGFFTAIPMRQVDPYAVLSSPLVLENWYWFWRQDTIAPESWRDGYKLGSILGSQQETWLGEAGYKVDMSANNLPQLIKLLQSKRIDVILADREHFVQATKEIKMDVNRFQSRFFRYVPLGVYFNEQFLNQNPDFLARFNQQITGCSTTRFALSDYEQQLIKELLTRKIERWKRLPKLESLLKERNQKSRRFTAQDIAERDKKWTQAFLRDDFSYSIKLVDQEMSAQLREIKKQSMDTITEIIVTDARGLNVAISDMTSDYWQGDEEKFTEVFAKPANTMHFGDINYDESTKRFQIHLSVPIYSEEKFEPLGVMVFGVDVEKVLSQAQ